MERESEIERDRERGNTKEAVALHVFDFLLAVFFCCIYARVGGCAV